MSNKALKYRQFNAKYVAIHGAQCAHSEKSLREAQKDDRCYHLLIDRKGKLHVTKQVKTTDGTIDIGIEAGCPKAGWSAKPLTNAQAETLFDTLVPLLEKCPEARIVSADKLYNLPAAAPGFDPVKWLAEYVPSLETI